MFRFFFQLLVFLCSISISEARMTDSSKPYISGDTFREYCDFIFDETHERLNPFKVKKGNTIFVKTDYLFTFFSKIHPLIKEKYILVSHNSDDGVTSKFERFLNDEKLIAWFAQNVENYSHPKLHPIPIGIANREWTHGNIHIIDELIKSTPNFHKNILLYMNFSIDTHKDERSKVAGLFQNQFYCVVESQKEFSAYLADLAQSKFVLSPRGNGLDCHRTWEALLMGAFPVVRTSSLDPIYEGLPVLILDDWSELNHDFLHNKYEEMKAKNYNLECLYFEYWSKLIDSYKP